MSSLAPTACANEEISPTWLSPDSLSDNCKTRLRTRPFRELAQLCETGFLEGSGSFSGCFCCCCWKIRAHPIQRAAISTIAALSLGLLIWRERARKYCALRRHSPAFMSPLPRIGFPDPTNDGVAERFPVGNR